MAFQRRRVDETTQVISTVTPHEEALRPVRDRAALTLLAGPFPGRLFTVEESELVVGRQEGIDGHIHDTDLSRRHARVFRTEGGFALEDLQSTNGTWLNGRRVTGTVELQDGDRIQMARGVLLRFHLQDGMEQEAAKRIYESAVRDPLTQLYNRRYLDERLASEFAYAVRHRVPLSVLLVDVDLFKEVNDAHGHAVGDEALRALASAMQRVVRVEDLLARYGGEEFCVAARGTSARQSRVLADRLRSTVEGLVLAIPGCSGPLRLTISIGVATAGPEGAFSELGALMAGADTALYEAKSAGRNRVVLAG